MPGIFDPSRLHPSAFDRIADRLSTRIEASKADVEAVKHRKHCEEAPTVTPELEMDPCEDNERMVVKVASVRDIPSDFRHLGAGLYKSAHALWELRTAEDGMADSYVLVRKHEERLVDLREDAPRDLATKSAAVYVDKFEAGKGDTDPFDFGDRVEFPRHGKVAQAVVIMMMPGNESAMLDMGNGEIAEESISEMSLVDGDGEDEEDSYLDPGHPELADLGPMSGVPDPDSVRIEMSDEMDMDGERDNDEGHDEGHDEQDRHADDRDRDDDETPQHQATRVTSNGWRPGIEPSSKKADTTSTTRQAKPWFSRNKEESTPKARPTLRDNISHGMMPGARVFDPASPQQHYEVQGYEPVRGPEGRGTSDFNVSLMPHGVQNGQPRQVSYKNELANWDYTEGQGYNGSDIGDDDDELNAPPADRSYADQTTRSGPSRANTQVSMSQMPTAVMRNIPRPNRPGTVTNAGPGKTPVKK